MPMSTWKNKKKKNVNFKGTDVHEKETNACQIYPKKLKKSCK